MASADDMQRMFAGLLEMKRIVIRPHPSADRNKAGDRIAVMGDEQFDVTRDQVQDLESSGAQHGE
jgi:hypothetical protein